MCYGIYTLPDHIVNKFILSEESFPSLGKKLQNINTCGILKVFIQDSYLELKYNPSFNSSIT